MSDELPPDEEKPVTVEGDGLTKAEIKDKKRTNKVSDGAATGKRTKRCRPNTHTHLILKYFLGGGTLTPLEAYERFGCCALHSAISEINVAHGIRCDREWVTVPNRKGKTCTVKQYWLSPGSEPWQKASDLIASIESNGGDLQ